VGIPVTRIFTINPRGEIVRQKLSQALSSSYETISLLENSNYAFSWFSYKNLHEVVDLIFPPMDSFSSSETYSGFTYWRQDPSIDTFDNEIRADFGRNCSPTTKTGQS
jgi:phosphatidate phosphatase PAH1